MKFFNGLFELLIAVAASGIYDKMEIKIQFPWKSRFMNTLNLYDAIRN